MKLAKVDKLMDSHKALMEEIIAEKRYGDIGNRLEASSATLNEPKIILGNPITIDLKWNFPNTSIIEDNVTVWEDGNKTITDRVLIIDNATLLLDNFTLFFNKSSEDALVGIVLVNNSKLILNGSTITYVQEGSEYFIKMEANTTLSILNNSVIEHAGSPLSPGIEVGYNYTTIGEEAVVEISDSIIRYCYNGITTVGKANIMVLSSSIQNITNYGICLLYTSPSPRDRG